MAALTFRSCALALTALLGLAATGAVVGVSASSPSPVSARPQKIVSLNLCADQYLLALADRDQIAGLTHNAGNPEMSAAADKARGLRILGESAEEVIAIRPDLVIGSASRRAGLMAAIAPHDYPTLRLRSAEKYDDIVAQIREVAAAVGHPRRGEALIAAMNRELATLPKAKPGTVAAYYQRRGFLTGTGTLVDDLMTRAGLINLAARMQRPAVSQLSIEELVAARPDYLIVESATTRVSDQGTEMLHHPALARVPRISLPQAWTVCGGPAYVRAAQSLAHQLNAR